MFIANKLTLNAHKTNFIKFVTNNKPVTNMQINYNDQYILEVKTTKFLGLQIDNCLNCKPCITQFIKIKLNMLHN